MAHFCWAWRQEARRQNKNVRCQWHCWMPATEAVASLRMADDGLRASADSVCDWWAEKIVQKKKAFGGCPVPDGWTNNGFHTGRLLAGCIFHMGESCTWSLLAEAHWNRFICCLFPYWWVYTWSVWVPQSRVQIGNFCQNCTGPSPASSDTSPSCSFLHIACYVDARAGCGPSELAVPCFNSINECVLQIQSLLLWSRVDVFREFSDCWRSIWWNCRLILLAHQRLVARKRENALLSMIIHLGFC